MKIRTRWTRAPDSQQLYPVFHHLTGEGHSLYWYLHGWNKQTKRCHEMGATFRKHWVSNTIWICSKKKKIWDRFSYTQGWPWIYLIGKDNLRFTVLVSPTSKCWYDMSEPPFLIYVILGIEPTALCMLVTPITNWITTKGHPFPTV